MALTGLQIQKLLPKTNCRECGSNTCLAFAMKLAGKKTELAECPYVSEEARAILVAESEPPMSTVSLGSGERSFQVGGEIVMFRHEKTFVNPTGIGLATNDAMSDAELAAKVRHFVEYRLERVGETLRPNLVSIEWRSNSIDRLLACVELVRANWSGAVAIRTDDQAALSSCAEKFAGTRLLLASATAATADALIAKALQTDCVLALASSELDELMALGSKAREAGLKSALLELRADTLCERYQSSAIVRRAALKAGNKALAFPLLTYIDSGNPMDDAVEAGIAIAKYGSLVVLPHLDPALAVSLLALRQNIYTDPQKPIQVEPKVYAIGEPGRNSPVFVTTNFSLTYFIVSGEIENSGSSAWLLIPECEGMSVLTAWAAGKFGGDRIGAFVKSTGLAEKLDRKRIVIPGYVAQISGELEEALPGWEVIVGPQEAGDIESFVKNVLSVA